MNAQIENQRRLIKLLTLGRNDQNQYPPCEQQDLRPVGLYELLDTIGYEWNEKTCKGLNGNKDHGAKG